MNQLKKLLAVSMLGLCIGCTSVSEPVATVSADVHETYASQVHNAPTFDNYTVTVTNSYVMSYSDSTMSAYDLDGTLEVDDESSNPVAHFTQNINANGMRSSFSGDYYGGRFYNTFNNVNYYEDMTIVELKQIMLVPVTPIVISDSLISSLVIDEGEDGTTYTIQIDEEYLKDFFLDRYDQYGLDQYDGFTVESGTIIDTFDEEGHFTGESTEFACTVTLSGETVNVVYNANVTYVLMDETEVVVSDETKNTQAEYVSFNDIDVSSIETLSSDDDSAEDSALATFEKRLVTRLGYEKSETGTYISSFNNDNESYMVKFDQYIFEYANRTIHYIYNWKSDTGIMGACTLDFASDYTTSDCVDTTVETIRDVKNWFQMELYYCGLSLEDILAETK